MALVREVSRGVDVTCRLSSVAMVLRRTGFDRQLARTVDALAIGILELRFGACDVTVCRIAGQPLLHKKLKT